MVEKMKLSRVIGISLALVASLAVFTAKADRMHDGRRGSFFAEYGRDTISENYLRMHLHTVMDAAEILAAQMKPETLSDARDSVEDTYSDLIGLTMKEAVEQIKDDADSPFFGPDWCDEDILDEEHQDFLAIMYWNVCVMSIIDRDWRSKLDASLRRYRMEGGRKPGRPHRVSRYGRKPAKGDSSKPAAKPGHEAPKPQQGAPKPAPSDRPTPPAKPAPSARPPQGGAH